MALFDRRDFDFLFDWLDFQALLQRDRFAAHAGEDVAAMLDLVERLAEDEVAPLLRPGDTNQPHLLPDGSVQVLPEIGGAVRQIAELGLFSAVFDEELGGLQLPHMTYVTAMGMLMTGSISVASYMLLTVGNARLISDFGTPAQVDAFARPQIAGEAMGTMCLSEPHAGSSLGDIRTRALADGQDELGQRYRLHGAKMWISAGDHDVTGNIVHLVLAKTPDENGVIGVGSDRISLFIVPKILPDGTLNDVVVTGLNHKMGYRGLPNCALNFGEGKHAPEGKAGAVGWLIGTLGKGLPQMFQMMNEARIGVGLGGASLAARGYQMSLDYARDRRQGRLPGVRDGEPVAIIEHADVRRMLLMQKAISQGAMGLVLYSARLLDDEKTAPTKEERHEAADLLALLTPVTKSWPSEWAQEALHQAIQIHGGSGYTIDFDVELLYRDNRLNPIHEGTTGIQGIDLVGRKLRKENGRTFHQLHAKVEASLARAAQDEVLRDGAASIAAGWRGVHEAAQMLLAEPDDRKALGFGTAFLYGFGHAVTGWLWLEQAMHARQLARSQMAGDERWAAAFLQGRLRAFDYFAQYEAPRIRGWLEPIFAGSDLLLTIHSDEF